MKNIELNVGGAIGATITGAIGYVGLYSLLGPDGGGYKVLIFAMIGGGLAGNFLWDRAFKKPDPDQSEQE